MEPAVRGARIEPTIVATRLETAFFASQDSEPPNRQTALCRSKRCRRERNFWTQRPEAKNPPERPLLSAETGDLKIRRQECRQKRPVSDRRRFPQFGKTGWWCAQSYANPSPCYLANIRVIFEKNSEPAAESVKGLQHRHFSNIAPIRYQGGTGSAQLLQHRASISNKLGWGELVTA